MNTLGDLNRALFAQLDRLSSASKEDLASEVVRAQNMEIISEQIIKTHETQLVLCENDIESAIAVEGTAVKRILSHIEMTIIQKALIYSKGNQRLAADQIGMSRTKLGYRVRGIRSNTSVRAAA